MPTRVIVRRTGVSDGARALVTALKDAGVDALLSDKTEFNRANRLIINWGTTDTIRVRHGRLLNGAEGVAKARNKLTTFETLQNVEGVNIPKWWTRPQDVQRARKDTIILERHSLTGEAGSGIVVKRIGEELGSAPLYVEYIRKTLEVRVHVVGGQAVIVQQKRKESAREQNNDEALIRNRDNGWVFVVNDQTLTPEQERAAKDMATRACTALGLDNGAVDMVFAKTGGQPYVLEVNTKPGLESPTVLEKYVARIREVTDGRAGT